MRRPARFAEHRGAVVALVALVLVGCRGGHHHRAAPVAEPAAPARTTEAIRRDGNHLVGEGSIYLQEHSHNPVDWYPWGPEALTRARKLGRPIFLSIGYSSCHWCHVMAAEVFEDDEVASFLNEHFVSIKVDREERPDLDATYMASLEAMTGGGGWPMSLFLTPGLRPFFGATYLPRARFLATAKRAWGQFSEARADVEAQADEVQKRIASDETGAAGTALDPAEIHAIALAAVARVDPEWGGFRGQTKFPLPVEWSFLLHTARKWGDTAIRDALRATLDAMAVGGIRDPIGGGFHRYSTDPRWEVPHFEKMLYDNAQLATLYLEAGVALGEPRYVEVATDTLDFLLREMQAPEGGFYASFDADSGGREGAYYVWSPEELRSFAGKADGDVLAALLGAHDGGPFGGASAVNRRASMADVAKSTGRSVTDVAALWERSRPALLAARAARPKPRADTKIVTGWNGLVIGALALGFQATGEVRYRDAAVRAAERVWQVHRSPAGALYRASNQGRPEEDAVLEDYAFLAGGLVALFQATDRADLLDHAVTLVTEANGRFHAEAGGWYDAAASAVPLTRSVALDDGALPTGSSALLHDDVALLSLTIQTELGSLVDATLAARSDALRRRGIGSAGWLDAALLRAGPFYDVVVSADAGAGDNLENAWRALLPPWAVLARVPAAGPDPTFEHLVAASLAKTSGAAPARAFVCSQGACKSPTADPGALRTQLLKGWMF